MGGRGWRPFLLQKLLHRIQQDAGGGVGKAAADDDFPGVAGVVEGAQQHAGAKIVALGALADAEDIGVQVQRAALGQHGAGMGAAQVQDAVGAGLVGVYYERKFLRYLYC